MRVIISAKAETDLENIIDYIGFGNPKRAITFAQELQKRCNSLSQMPYRFAIAPELRHKNIRRCIHKHYVILYTVNDDTVVIQHIFHASRDYIATYQ